MGKIRAKSDTNPLADLLIAFIEIISFYVLGEVCLPQFFDRFFQKYFSIFRLDLSPMGVLSPNFQQILLKSRLIAFFAPVLSLSLDPIYSFAKIWRIWRPRLVDYAPNFGKSCPIWNKTNISTVGKLE